MTVRAHLSLLCCHNERTLHAFGRAVRFLIGAPRQEMLGNMMGSYVLKSSPIQISLRATLTVPYRVYEGSKGTRGYARWLSLQPPLHAVQPVQFTPRCRHGLCFGASRSSISGLTEAECFDIYT